MIGSGDGGDGTGHLLVGADCSCRGSRRLACVSEPLVVPLNNSRRLLVFCFFREVADSV